MSERSEDKLSSIVHCHFSSHSLHLVVCSARCRVWIYSHEHQVSEACECGGCDCFQPQECSIQSHLLINPLASIRAIAVIDQPDCFVSLFETVHLGPARVWPRLKLLCCKVLVWTWIGDFRIWSIVGYIEDSDTSVLGSGNFDWREVIWVCKDGLKVGLGQVLRIDVISWWVDHDTVAASILA